MPAVRFPSSLAHDPHLPPVSDAPDVPVAETMLAELGYDLDVVTIACAAAKIAGSPTPQADVVFYSAHPDDESMYGGGTMCALTRGGQSVSLVVLSHGEGGRLLVPGSKGVVEDRSRPRAEVARIRDVETANAAAIAGVDLDYLFDHGHSLDFAFSTSVRETLAAWSEADRGGLAAIVARIVDDIRSRRPRVIVTLDVRDDPGGSAHAHHRALGALVQIAARLAADPRVGGRSVHAVEEVATYAPEHANADVEMKVDVADRAALIGAHASQFTPEERKSALATRPTERFVIARQLGPRRASVLASLL